jgi:hypothetical protein
MTLPFYKTTDTYLASFLLSQDFFPVNWERLTPKKVLFRFEADERLHDLLRLYWSGQPILIAPVGLFAALRKLKSRTLVRMGADLLNDLPTERDGDFDGPDQALQTGSLEATGPRSVPDPIMSETRDAQEETNALSPQRHADQ